jgi:hypothetical protein
MRKYRITAASPIRVDYGVELVAGLRRFPETAVFADDFEKLNDGLFTQYLARLSARKPMVAARVPVRIGNYETDQVIRACAHAAEEVDGCKGGPIFKSIFKDGLGPAVRPNGAAQIPATQTVIDSLVKSGANGIDTFRATWLPKLQSSLDTLKNAAKVLDARRKDYLDAFRDEVALRNQHWTEVDRLMGQVRATFPGSTVKQDLVFPEVVEDEEEEKATAEQAAAAAGQVAAAAPSAQEAQKPG